jgi:hypothetical protein
MPAPLVNGANTIPEAGTPVKPLPSPANEPVNEPVKVAPD